MISNRWSKVLPASAASVLACLFLADAAHASLDILPTFDPSITGLSNAAEVEGAINNAISAIQSNFANPMTVPIVFMAAHDGTNGFLGASSSTFYADTFGDYTGLLASAATAHPENTTLNTAVAHLGSGNQGGTDGMIATNTVFQALGIPAASGPGGIRRQRQFYRHWGLRWRHLPQRGSAAHLYAAGAGL